MAVKKEPTKTFTIDGGRQFSPLSKPKKSTSKKDGSRQKRSK